MRCEEAFFEKYNKLPEGVSFVPYRICPLGAHIDHQGGRVSGFAINKGVNIAYSVKNNGVVEMSSFKFPKKRAQWHIDGVPKHPENDWADYLRGATLVLSRRYALVRGISGVVEGELPIGGLASSSALTLAFILALGKANGIILGENELIEIALLAEKRYVGVLCGTLDQSAEVLSRKNHLLYLDTKTGEYELIPENRLIKPYKIAIFFSGVERQLVGSGFNTRVDECRAAAFSLLAYAGLNYTSLDSVRLCDVPEEAYLKYGKRLPENFKKRAEHYYTENKRVEMGASAWRRGDIEELGRLIFESGKSSIDNYETGTKMLKTLFELMQAKDGIYGARFSGAGFNGSTLALIDPGCEEKIKTEITREYLEIFPELSNSFSVHICESTDGVKHF